MRSTAITDINIWSINSPALNVQFERRAGSLLTLDSWVDVNTIDDEHNPLQEVCRRGFHVPDASQGLTFSVGNVKFDGAVPGA